MHASARVSATNGAAAPTGAGATSARPLASSVDARAPHVARADDGVPSARRKAASIGSQSCVGARAISAGEFALVPAGAEGGGGVGGARLVACACIAGRATVPKRSSALPASSKELVRVCASPPCETAALTHVASAQPAALAARAGVTLDARRGALATCTEQCTRGARSGATLPSRGAACAHGSRGTESTTNTLAPGTAAVGARGARARAWPPCARGESAVRCAASCATPGAPPSGAWPAAAPSAAPSAACAPSAARAIGGTMGSASCAVDE